MGRDTWLPAMVASKFARYRPSFPVGVPTYVAAATLIIATDLFFALGQVYSEKRRCTTCDAIEGGSFAAEGPSICERGLVQCGTPNYSSESEDETENEIGSASDNESESEDEVGSTEETENALATETEDEAEN